MKGSFYITILFLIISPLFVSAEEQKAIDRSLENISGQYAECTAYYELVYHAMNSSNEKETAEMYKELANNAMFYSLLLANEGREKDIAVNVTNSRIDMYKKKMLQEADNRNENISILINNYHYDCEKLMTNPPNEVAEILEKQLENLDK